MSSNIIQADFDQLNQVMQRFGVQAEATGQLIALIQNQMVPLQNGGWQGRGADAFFAEMAEDFLPGMYRLQSALEQASQVTQQIDNTLRGAEEEAAGTFERGGGMGNSFPGIGAGIGGAVGGAIGGAIGDRIGTFPGNGIPIGDGLIGIQPIGTFPGLFPDGGFGFGPDILPGSGIGGGAGGNDFGIPQDWLSGVTNSLAGGGSGGTAGSEGLPNNWLDGVLGAAGAEGMGGASGGGSGGASGGGSGGGAPGLDSQPSSSEATAPTSGGGSGGSPSPTDISSPYSGDGRGFSSGGGSSSAASTSSAGGFAHQSRSGGAGAPVAQEAMGTGVTAVSGGAAPTEAGGSNGLALGLAAASPLVAVLGKLITGRRDD